MQRNAWTDIANWRTTQPNNDTQTRRRALMTTKFKEEEIGSVGELSTVCSQIVLNVFSWLVLVDLRFYGL